MLMTKWISYKRYSKNWCLKSFDWLPDTAWNMVQALSQL
jgi:hypothetical protein